MSSNPTTPLPTLHPETRAAILASAPVVSICKHPLQVAGGNGRMLTLYCSTCGYELNVLTDHLRRDRPRLALSDEEHSRISTAFDAAWNGIVAIASTLQLLISGEVTLEYMQSEIVDRIGKLGGYRDGLEEIRTLLDLPEASPLHVEDREDWLSPDVPFARPVGEKTEELEELDEDTQEREAIHVNIYTDPAASRAFLCLEESEEK